MAPLFETPEDTYSQREIVDAVFGFYPDVVVEHYPTTSRTDALVVIPSLERRFIVESKDRYSYCREFMKRRMLRIDLSKVRALNAKAEAAGATPFLAIRTSDLWLLVWHGHRAMDDAVGSTFWRQRGAVQRGETEDESVDIPLTHAKVWMPPWADAALKRAGTGDLWLFARRIYADMCECCEHPEMGSLTGPSLWARQARTGGTPRARVKER